MKSKCKFYNADAALKKECNAGVNVRELVGGENFGWLLRTPCFTNHETNITCEKFQPITEEEAEEKKEELLRYARATLRATLMITCPHCRETLDLFEDDSDSVFLVPIFNNKWEDIEGQDVECPKCEKEFFVKSVEW